MRVFLFLLFLTLVLNVGEASAAPTTKTTLETSPLIDANDPQLAKDVSHEHEKTSRINIGVGFEGGNFIKSDEWLQGIGFSLRYSPLEDEIVNWDFEASVNKENLVGVFVGRRWTVTKDLFQPYVRLAGGSYFNGSGELGNFVQAERFRLRASAGIGTVIQFEFGAGIAGTGPDAFARLSYNFDF